MKYGTMIYLASRGKVLMIKKGSRPNDPNSGYFTLPGGKLEQSEKGISNRFGRIKSVIREAKEEIGIRLIRPKLIGVILFDNKDRKFDNWPNPDNFLVYIYRSRKFKGKIKRSEEGIPFKIPLKKVTSLPSNPGDKLMYKWINHSIKHKKFFNGIIKHKGKEIDYENSWVDFY